MTRKTKRISEIIRWIAILVIFINTGEVFGTNKSNTKPISSDSIAYISSAAYITNDNEYNIVIASLKGDYNVVESLLKNGLSANTTLDDGSFPLLFAAEAGNIRICKLLIEKGANVNLVPRNGQTALIGSILAKHENITDLLIEKGANINLPDYLGKTPLIHAASIDDTAMCVFLLKNNADLKAKDNFGTDAFMTAVVYGQKASINLLLKYKADPNTYDKKGVTPIMILVKNNDIEYLDTLIVHGADINKVSKHGNSALSIALEKNDELLVNKVIEFGANVNQKLTFAENPMIIAKYNKTDKFIIETLQNKGAKNNYWPDFKQYTIGTLVNWNLKDFMAGFTFGVKEIKYGIDINGGMAFRPFYVPILIEDLPNNYSQYYEYRHIAFVGIDKNINILYYNEDLITGINLGLNYAYSFGSYKGTDMNAKDMFVPIPQIGVYEIINGFQFGLSYQFCDFNTEGVSANRICFTAKIILGHSYKFDYK